MAHPTASRFYETYMDIQMNIETGNTFFSSSQDQLSRRSEGCEVAIYLRNGSIWVGHFINDHGELNFGDDRPDAAHGLGDLLHAEVLKTEHTCSSS
jgi:hypothetical protein